MRTGQVADAHQELIHDLAAGKAKGLPKELDPFFFGARVMGGKPTRKRAVRGSKLQNLASIRDGRIHLQPVANDPLVGQQPVPVGISTAKPS